MERRTFEFAVAGVLIAIVAALSLIQYHQSLPRFHEVSCLSLTGTVTAVRLKRPPPDRLNINAATLAELDALPGISAAIARAIIAQRHNQPFTEFCELARIPGIGPKRLTILAELVYCGDTPDYP